MLNKPIIPIIKQKGPVQHLSYLRVSFVFWFYTFYLVFIFFANCTLQTTQLQSMGEFGADMGARSRDLSMTSRMCNHCTKPAPISVLQKVFIKSSAQTSLLLCSFIVRKLDLITLFVKCLFKNYVQHNYIVREVPCLISAQALFYLLNTGYSYFYL